MEALIFTLSLWQTAIPIFGYLGILLGHVIETSVFKHSAL